MRMKKAFQAMILGFYRAVLATGILRTAPGRRIFQWCYGAYKRWFEAGQIHQLRRFVAPGTTVIDVGANIGFFTRHFAAWVSDPGRVVAIEPDHENFLQLRRVIESAGYAGVVDLVAGAAAEAGGTLHLARNPLHPGDHKLGESGVPVTAYTLDGLLEQRQWPAVSLIKIDVQGAESRVLQGACETLERCRPALYVEIDDRALAESGSSAKQLIDRLMGAGYRCFDLADEALSKPLDAIAIGQRRAALGYGDFLFVSSTPLMPPAGSSVKAPPGK